MHQSLRAPAVILSVMLIVLCGGGYWKLHNPPPTLEPTPARELANSLMFGETLAMLKQSIGINDTCTFSADEKIATLHYKRQDGELTVDTGLYDGGYGTSSQYVAVLDAEFKDNTGKTQWRLPSILTDPRVVHVDEHGRLQSGAGPGIKITYPIRGGGY